MGLDAPPAVAGNTCNSYNPTLWKTGTKYKVVTKYSLVDPPPPFTTVDKIKVMGLATFHGHKLIRIHHHIDIAYPGKKDLLIHDEFIKIGGTSIYDYGGRNQLGGGFYLNPPVSSPKQYVINVPYSSANGAKLSSPGHATIITTFVGMESVKVPAGTFTACKLKRETLSGREKTPSISYQWVVSSGRYAGLPIKNDVYSRSGSSILKSVALSLQVNGK